MKPSDIATPRVPALKPNLDIPRNAPPVERQTPGPNSPNPAGGYVPPDRFTNK